MQRKWGLESFWGKCFKQIGVTDNGVRVITGLYLIGGNYRIGPYFSKSYGTVLGARIAQSVACLASD